MWRRAHCTPSSDQRRRQDDLIGALAGEVRPDAGHIAFEGADISTLPTWRRNRRGLARSFQITSLFADFTALDNVALAVQPIAATRFASGKRHAGECAARARPRRAGARGVERTRRHAGGAAQPRRASQLEIALALASRPRLILLDEPLAGMGPAEADRNGRHAVRPQAGIDHFVDRARYRGGVCARGPDHVLDYGRIVASAAPEEIRGMPVRRAYLGEAEAQARKRPMAEAFIEVENLETWLRIEPGSVRDVACDRAKRDGDPDGPQRHGQDHDRALDHGSHPGHAGLGSPRWPGNPRLAAHRVAGLVSGWCRRAARCFPISPTRENLVATAANRSGISEPWTLDKVYRLFRD